MNSKKPNQASIILILGALIALSPFSIDMYLPAFPQIAENFHTTVAEISLSLSSYFIGLAVGQLFYGPLLDRFGRKKPLYVGMGIFVLATLGCLTSTNADSLIAFRFLQALGGCVANVSSIAMVRDFFSPKESAKVFSLLILILGVSPLLAPTVGGYLAAAFGWQSIFIALALIALLILGVVIFALPDSHTPDHSQSLRPAAIFKNYLAILKEPQFYTYTLAGSIAFSGLFAYLAASPTIFMEIFKVSGQVYGWIFAFLSIGFIGASQINIYLLRKYSNEKILLAALIGLSVVGLVFVIGALNDWYGLAGTIAVLFTFLACVGLSNPNSSALAMAPFAKNAGSASALMGSLQMGIGAISAAMVSILKAQQILPIAGIFAGSALLALSILVFGSKRIASKVTASEGDSPLISH